MLHRTGEGGGLTKIKVMQGKFRTQEEEVDYFASRIQRVKIFFDFRDGVRVCLCSLKSQAIDFN